MLYTLTPEESMDVSGGGPLSTAIRVASTVATITAIVGLTAIAAPVGITVGLTVLCVVSGQR